MTTDLREALRRAAERPSDDLADLRAVIDAGARRVRRRRLLATVGSVAAMTAVVGVVAVGGQMQPEREPSPSKVVHLDLDGVARVDLDLLASVRSAPNNSRKLDQQPLGITPDGLVVRYQRGGGGGQRLGLLDPSTGATQWYLMPGTTRPVEPAALTADSVVLWQWHDVHEVEVLTFDRRSTAWRSTELELPAGIEVHGPPQVQVGADGRFYVGSNMENLPFEMRWWSYGRDGGEGRPEPGLTGTALAWADGQRVTADADGRVVVSVRGAERVVARARPENCDRPEPAFVTVAGVAEDRAVVTWWCDGSPPVTALVTDAAPPIEVAGAMAVAADEGRALLRGADEKHTGEGDTFWSSDENTYLLDPTAATLSLVDDGSADFAGWLAGGLVVWGASGGPGHERDVVWKVARLP